MKMDPDPFDLQCHRCRVEMSVSLPAYSLMRERPRGASSVLPWLEEEKFTATLGADRLMGRGATPCFPLTPPAGES